MKKNLQFTKQTYLLLLAFLLVMSCFAGCAKKSAQEEAFASYADLPISYMEADFAYDPSDIRQAVGIVDYVFVGKVEAEVETRYLRLTSRHDPDTGEEIPRGIPNTAYTILVQENIKGELIIGEPIEIVKDGGISMDKSYIELYADDSMPEPGKTYIFSAYAQENGDLLISGPRSNVELPEGEDATALIMKYQAAYENESIPTERYRYVSRYDVAEAGK